MFEADLFVRDIENVTTCTALYLRRKTCIRYSLFSEGSWCLGKSLLLTKTKTQTES